MAAASGRPTRAQRVFTIVTWAVILFTAAVALFFVIAAGLFYVKYDEPDPDIAKRFAAAIRSADGPIDMTAVRPAPWDTVSVIGSFTDLAAVRACIGVDDWDQDGALADRLAADNRTALVFVKAGAVSAATWSVWQHLPF